MRSAFQRKDIIRRALEAGTVQDSGSNRRRLVVRTGNGVVLLSVDEIEYFEADGNRVVVHAANRTYWIRAPLATLLSRLADSGFIRIHRCTVVRASAITAVEKSQYRKAVTVLRSGARLEIGRAEFNRLRPLWRPGLLDLDQLTSTLRLTDDVLARA